MNVLRRSGVGAAVTAGNPWKIGYIVLAPTFGVLSSLTARRTGGRVLLWGRGVDGSAFGPSYRDEALRTELLAGGDLLLLSVGRVSDEKRIDVLLDAFAELRRSHPGALGSQQPAAPGSARSPSSGTLTGSRCTELPPS